MRKCCLLFGLGLVLACEGSLEESGEVAPQTEDPNISATLPAIADASAPSIESEASIGKKDVDASVEASADAGTDAQPAACPDGVAETEPNDTTTKASTVAMGENCGSIAAGDTDFWAVGDGTLEVDAASDDVAFALVDENGLVTIPIFPGEPIDFKTSGSLFLRVTSKSKQSYSIVRE